uniref:Mannose-specific lectin-like n=2 Tax=Sparus aurata TaxID=8175 RepID=A0A671XZL8_SPAAU
MDEFLLCKCSNRKQNQIQFTKHVFSLLFSVSQRYNTGFSFCYRIMSQNALLKNEELQRGEHLVSNNGRWKAVFQDDANFVIYDDGKAVWASDTNGSGGFRLRMQGDCNLVIYDRGAVAKWATNTYQPNEVHMCRVVLTDDGKLELYRDEHIWSSAHSCGKKL